MVLAVQVPGPTPILCRTSIGGGGGHRGHGGLRRCAAPRDPPTQILYPSRGGLGLRGEGDVRRLMLHSRFVEGLEPCDITEYYRFS